MDSSTTKNLLSTSLKVTGNRTTYRALEMSDAAVYEMARHWFTLDEIAESFNVSKQTVLEKHGDAFNLGKKEGMMKPRMLLNKILSDFSAEELNFARGDVPTGTLLKAMELHARKYEGLGSTQTVITKTEEKPSVADFKFFPLDAPQE